jgi:hypothetical protein
VIRAWFHHHSICEPLSQAFATISTETGTEIYASVDLVSYPTLVQLHVWQPLRGRQRDRAAQNPRFAIGERYVVWRTRRALSR